MDASAVNYENWEIAPAVDLDIDYCAATVIGEMYWTPEDCLSDTNSVVCHTPKCNLYSDGNPLP